MSGSRGHAGHHHHPPERGSGAAAGRDRRDPDDELRGPLAEKDKEILKLNRQLEKAVEELKKLTEHTKTQSKRIQELQSSQQVSYTCMIVYTCV